MMSWGSGCRSTQQGLERNPSGQSKWKRVGGQVDTTFTYFFSGPKGGACDPFAAPGCTPGGDSQIQHRSNFVDLKKVTLYCRCLSTSALLN